MAMSRRAAEFSAGDRPSFAEMLSDLYVAIEPVAFNDLLGGWTDTEESLARRKEGARERLAEMVGSGLAEQVDDDHWRAIGPDAELAHLPRQPDRPTVPDVLPIARAYVDKPENGSGGSLHIVLADPNYETGHVAYCLADAHERHDDDGIALARLLMRMTVTQRAKVAHQCWHHE